MDIRRCYDILDVPLEASSETSSSDEIRPQPKIEPRVELYLETGGVIMATSFRLEGDMIVYRIAGGSMGIQRSKVKSIKVRRMVVE